MKLTTLLATFLIASTAIAEEPVELKIFPESAQLKTLRDRQSFVVQAFYANGITRDVTKEAKFALANGALCKLENATLYPACLLYTSPSPRDRG